MTAEEEKAKELYDKFKGFRIRNTHAKTCAIKAAEILMDHDIDERTFWEEVRDEIKKIKA